MAKMPKKVTPYSFDAIFEQIVVTLACSSQRFYGRVGHALDPALMKSLPGQHAIQAAHQINADIGHGPAAPVLVIQRLRRWMNDGKITLEAIKDVAELFDNAEDAGLPDEDSVVSELAPILQQRIRDEAVEEAIASYGKHGDLAKVVSLEHRAARIGTVDTSVGTMLGAESFAEVAKFRQIQRLATGILELDSVLDGGLENGGLGVVVGSSGDGKSMFLSHVTGVAVVDSLFVAYATLELPKEVVLARVKANITGVPINVMMGGEISEAQARLEALPSIGRLVVQYFAPKATTFDDLKIWLDNVESMAGRKIDLLVVDYGDKVGAKAKKGEQQSEYTGALAVFEAFRHYAQERKIFCWTASQASRQKDARKKILDLNDTADSMHKIRVADLVVTLNLEDDGTEEPMVVIYIAKHRTGKSRVKVGPMPTEYERGRICPMMEHV